MPLTVAQSKAKPRAPSGPATDGSTESSEEPNCFNDGKSTMRCRATPGAVVHQNGAGVNLTRRTNGFQLAGVQVQQKEATLQ
jgi:hypothetical protein